MYQAWQELGGQVTLPTHANPFASQQPIPNAVCDMKPESHFGEPFYECNSYVMCVRGRSEPR